MGVELIINTKEDLMDAVQGAILGRRRRRLQGFADDLLIKTMDDNINLTKYMLDNRSMNPASRHEMEKVMDKLTLMKNQYIELVKTRTKLEIKYDNQSIAKERF